MDTMIDNNNPFPQGEDEILGEYLTTISLNGVQSQFTPSLMQFQVPIKSMEYIKDIKQLQMN